MTDNFEKKVAVDGPVVNDHGRAWLVHVFPRPGFAGRRGTPRSQSGPPRETNLCPRNRVRYTPNNYRHGSRLATAGASRGRRKSRDNQNECNNGSIPEARLNQCASSSVYQSDSRAKFSASDFFDSLGQEPTFSVHQRPPEFDHRRARGGSRSSHQVPPPVATSTGSDRSRPALNNGLPLMQADAGTSAPATRHDRKYRMRREPIGSHCIGTAIVAKCYRVARRANWGHAHPWWRYPNRAS